MIANDSEKEWMLPLLQFRNQYLGNLEDRPVRDFRRMNGSLFVHHDRLVHGPYTQDYRAVMLKALLEAQEAVNRKLPSGLNTLELITMNELQETRRIWLEDKREIEDHLPAIYRSVCGKDFPSDSTPVAVLRPDEVETLRGVSQLAGVDSNLHYQLVRDLITTHSRARGTQARARLLEELDEVLDRMRLLMPTKRFRLRLGAASQPQLRLLQRAESARSDRCL